MIWPDGSIYEGQWFEDKIRGLGKFTHFEGDSYEGDWIENKANGWGK